MANNEIGKGAQAFVVLASMAIVAAAIKLAAAFVAPLLVACFIAIAVQPIFRWVHRSPIPDFAAIVISLFAVVGILSLFVGLIVMALANFSGSAVQYLSSLHQLQMQATLWLEAHHQHTLAQSLYNSRFETLLQEATTSVVLGVPALLSTLVTVLLLIVFMLLELTTLPKRFRTALGWSSNTIKDFSRTMSEIQRYLSVKTATSAATGLCAGLWCALCGVPNPVLWGLVAFALHYVPTVGSLVAAMPPILIALSLHGVGRAALVAVGLAVSSSVIGNIIEPNALGRSLSVSPLIVLVSMFAWGWLLGPIGALLSVPLTLITKIVLWNTSDLHWVAVLLGPTPPAGTRNTDLPAPRDSLLPPPPPPSSRPSQVASSKAPSEAI
ncbi:MAG TPA: AI-2E family transporter [Polyangiaceae bacterium]|jgi:predicted PurR-regulated permease PerM|nr:AI-2E family transporter [Polyangiaceae bacterium]